MSKTTKKQLAITADLLGRTLDEPSYVVDAAMQPSNLGHIEFLITPTRSQSKPNGTDYVGIEIGAIQ
jgi:hypothetical protein